MIKTKLDWALIIVIALFFVALNINGNTILPFTIGFIGIILGFIKGYREFRSHRYRKETGQYWENKQNGKG